MNIQILQIKVWKNRMWKCRQASEEWHSAGFVLVCHGAAMHRQKSSSEEPSGPKVSALTLLPRCSILAAWSRRHLSGSFSTLKITFAGLNLGSSEVILPCLICPSSQIKCIFTHLSVNYLSGSQQHLQKSCYCQHLLNCLVFSTLWRLFLQWLSLASSLSFF